MENKPIRIAIVGVGKIARDQHLPSLAANADFELAGVVSRREAAVGVPEFPDIGQLIAGTPGLDAVSICTPPQGRHPIAREAIEAGLHVMLEKPPGATVREVEYLVDAARGAGVALFAAWHLREAAAVAPAKAWLADQAIRSVQVNWKEDVRRWHPGQAWIWEPGGLGVFDPGINALSVITQILPFPLILGAAELFFPVNRAMPIAALLDLGDTAGTKIRADFDWRQTGTQSWDIIVETDGGQLRLTEGGSRLEIGGEPVACGASDGEYPRLYRRFAELVRQRAIDADLAPFRLVADGFMLGRRTIVAPFEDEPRESGEADIASHPRAEISR